MNLEEEPGVEADKAGGGEVEVQGGAVGDGVKPVDSTGEHARRQKAKAHHRRASVEISPAGGNKPGGEAGGGGSEACRGAALDKFAPVASTGQQAGRQDERTHHRGA